MLSCLKNVSILFFCILPSMFLPKVDIGQERNDFIKQKFDNLEKDNQFIKLKLTDLASMVAKNSVYLERLCANTFPKPSKFNFFPIKSMKDFDEIEGKISTFSETELLQYIRETIGTSSISKAVTSFFTENFMLQINWDGHHHKNGIKNSKLFSEHVFNAVRSEQFGFQDYEAAFKMGIRTSKNRYYRKTFRSKSEMLKNQKNMLQKEHPEENNTSVLD